MTAHPRSPLLFHAVLLASLVTSAGCWTSPVERTQEAGAAAAQAGSTAGSAASHAAGGHLVIIGGGRRPSEVMQRFVELAGGAERANILVLPMASSEAVETGKEQADEFRQMHVRRVRSWNMSRQEAEQPGVADSLRGVTGIYFTGGDQALIMAVLHATPAEQAIHRLYRSGAVIGGTSAGAAVMSEVMITGNEKRYRDTVNAFTAIRRDNIETVPGLGLVTNAIIDQHFIRRKRHNRLISVVLEHPSLLGIGIDERTAIIVNPDSTMDVMGNGSVLMFDARKAVAIKADSLGMLSGSNVLMHLLAPGEGYDFRTGLPRTHEAARP